MFHKQKITLLSFTIACILATYGVSGDAFNECPASNPNCDQEKWTQFENWVNKNCLPGIDGATIVEENNDRKLVATRSLKQDELVFKVPQKCYISEARAITDSDLVERVVGNTDIKLHNTPHITLALYIIDHVHHENSFFKQYFDSLPKELKSIPHFWNEDETENLQGSYLLEELKAMKKNVQEDYDTISKLVPDFPQRCPFKACFLLRFYQVASRSFTVLDKDGNYQHALVPFADMLNAKEKKFHIGWPMEDKDNLDFTLKTVQPVKEGEELFTTYGPKSNSYLLLKYGFTLEDNDQDTVALHLSLDEDDTLLKEKTDFVSKKERMLRLSAIHSQPSTGAVLGFLRVKVATKDEFVKLTKEPVPLHNIPYVSIEHETRMLKELVDLLEKRLTEYKSDLPKETENDINISRVIEGEKEVCAFWKKLAVKVMEDLEEMKERKFRVMTLWRFLENRSKFTKQYKSYTTFLARYLNREEFEEV